MQILKGMHLIHPISAPRKTCRNVLKVPSNQPNRAGNMDVKFLSLSLSGKSNYQYGQEIQDMAYRCMHKADMAGALCMTMTFMQIAGAEDYSRPYSCVANPNESAE